MEPLIRFLALFDGEIRAVLPSLGKHIGVNSSKAEKILGITFIPAEDSLVETANYLIENRFVKPYVVSLPKPAQTIRQQPSR